MSAAFRPLILIFLVLLISGCAGGSGDDEANFRVINALSDVSGVDLYIDDKEYVLGLGYSEETGYGFIEDGAREFLITVSGQFTSLGELRATIDSGIDYSLLVVGTPLNPRGLFLKDNNDEPASNTAKIRLVNGLAQAAVDVYVTAPSASIGSTIPSMEGMSFGSVSGYLVSASGTYRVRVTLRNSALVIADSGSVELKDGEIWTAVLSRRESDDTGEVLWFRDRE